MPTSEEELNAYINARWDEVHEAKVKATQATLLLLAQRALEEYPTATGIRLGDSDQGHYMACLAVLDATGTDLDEDGDFDDDGYCSAFDDANAGTWQAYCIEGAANRRHSADYIIQIDQVLAAGSSLVAPPRTIEDVEKFLDDTDDDVEPDGAPCCPDPDCPGRGRASGCTFPGYADNH